MPLVMGPLCVQRQMPQHTKRWAERRPGSRTLWGSEMGLGERYAAFSSEDGQATVEAAVLLPAVMVVLALLLQPAMLLYTRAIMSGAAAEGARLATTATHDEVTSLVDGYVRRRLRAVPDVSCFHAGGGDAWEVAVMQDGGRVRVSVVGHAQPLPLVGVMAGLVGQTDGEGVLLLAEVERDMRSEWVGGDYGDWIAAWG